MQVALEDLNRTDGLLPNQDSIPIPADVRESLLAFNPILDIWRVGHIANYYVFPMFREFDRTLGLNRAQFVSLLCISHGNAETAQEIVVGSGLPKNSISRAVRTLETKQLISRRKSRTDGRSIQLSMTEDGHRLLETCLAYAKRREAEVFSTFSDDEKVEFQRLIAKLCQSVPKWAAMEEVAEV